METMKILIFFLLSAVPALGGTPSALAAEIVDRIVAVVGNEVITLSDVNEFQEQRELNAKLNKNIKKASLESLIDEELLNQEINRLKLTATEREIEAALQEILARNKTTQAGLSQELSAKGSSLKKFKKDLSLQIQQMKFMGSVIFPRIKITEEEIGARMGSEKSEKARFHARLKLLEERSPKELENYLKEVRKRIYVEIK